MSKSNKKHAAIGHKPPTGLKTNEVASPTPKEATAPKERAPRISRPRFFLVYDNGNEIRFTHYPLPTRRQASGTVTIDGASVSFTVTKSQSKDKTENRAYSYLTLPNGSTGYVSQELVTGNVFTLKELPPAEPFKSELAETRDAVEAADAAATAAGEDVDVTKP